MPPDRSGSTDRDVTADGNVPGDIEPPDHVIEALARLIAEALTRREARDAA